MNKILIYYNQDLRKKSLDINKKNKEVKNIIKNMIEIMEKKNGIGISAPQIGKNIKIFIVDTKKYYNLGEEKIFINPQIVKKYGKIINQKEGCLSIPNVIINIPRNEKVKIQYLNEKWEKEEKKFSGIISRIIQHEYDHLNGILHIDYLINSKKKNLKKKILKLKNNKKYHQLF